MSIERFSAVASQIALGATLFIAGLFAGMMTKGHTVRIEQADLSRALEDCTTQVSIADAALTLANATFESMGATSVVNVNQKVK